MSDKKKHLLNDFLPESERKKLQEILMRHPGLIRGTMVTAKSPVEDILNEIVRFSPQTRFFVGAGTCGFGAGVKKTIERIREYLIKNKIDGDIVQVGCIGLCSSEPIVEIGERGRGRVSFGHVTSDRVEDILDSWFSGKVASGHVLGQHLVDGEQSFPGVPGLNEHPFFRPQKRIVLEHCGIIDPGSIEEYMAIGGYASFAEVISKKTPVQVCEMVLKSGLRGRGGGGFPTGKKWKLALDEVSDKKYMICNADEGDPGAFMDRALIEGDPHKLLEGLSIAAYAIGASTAYIYIRAEYPLAIQRLEKAISDSKKYGLIGENIFDSGYSLDIVIKKGAGAFVCGEETALINSIEGKRGMPRPRPPYPVEKGLFGNPTVINNVETLSNIPLIVRDGIKVFSNLGTETSKGTKVFALSGKVSLTGLIEVEMGTSIRDIIFKIGGGVPNGKSFKAVQIGGPSGGCIPLEQIDIEIDYESLRTVGAMMGSGGLVVMDEDTCMVDVAKYFLDFIQRESCGKCIPCREGTRRMLEILESITRSRKSEGTVDPLTRFQGIVHIEEIARVIQDTSLCGLGQSAPNPLLSTLRWFRDEYESHVFDRKCPAGACRDLLTYSIDPERCTGCTLCSRKCPVQAIEGEVKGPHIIHSDKCVGCGLCLNLCKFGAVKIS